MTETTPSERREEAHEEAAESLDNAVEAEREHEESVAEAAQEAVEEVAETAESAAKAVAEETEATAETAAEEVEELVEETTEAAEEAAESAGITDVEAVVEQAVNRVLDHPRLHGALNRTPVADVADRVAEVEEGAEVDMPVGELPVAEAEPVVHERDPMSPQDEHWWYRPRRLFRRSR